MIIGVIGAGYVGLVTGGSSAHMGNTVIIVPPPDKIYIQEARVLYPGFR